MIYSATTITVSNTDVICNRGQGAAKHPGNIQFLARLAQAQSTYNRLSEAAEDPRKCKQDSAQEIVNYFLNEGVRFLKIENKKDNSWVHLSQRAARVKVSQVFRDFAKKPSFCKQYRDLLEKSYIGEQLLSNNSRNNSNTLPLSKAKSFSASFQSNGSKTTSQKRAPDPTGDESGPKRQKVKSAPLQNNKKTLSSSRNFGQVKAPALISSDSSDDMIDSKFVKVVSDGDGFASTSNGDFGRSFSEYGSSGNETESEVGRSSYTGL